MEPGWGGVCGAGINVRHQSQKQSTFTLHGRVVVVVVFGYNNIYCRTFVQYLENIDRKNM